MARVLLVEDNAIVQHVHKLMLKKLGHEVELTENGNTTLSLLANDGNYDLIFVDIGLPDINGIELIKEIKKVSKIPIIALTGYISQSDKNACFSAGASEVLHKPIVNHDLKQLLSQYLSRNSTEILIN